MSRVTGEFIVRTEALTGNLVIRDFELSKAGMPLVKVYNEHTGKIYILDAQLLEVIKV